MPASDWEDIDNRLEREDRKTREVILKNRSAASALRILVRAGADKDKTLRLLSFCVHQVNWWQTPVRRKKIQLVSIANQLETVAKHAERISLDPLSYGTMWLFLLQLGKWEDVKQAEDCSPKFIFNLMREYARNCRVKAKAFGNLLKQYPARQKRQMIDCLMLRIWIGTGKHFDKEVALLLTSAFEAAGVARQFTEDQIKKHRQRYVMPRIKEYQRNRLGSGGLPTDSVKPEEPAPIGPPKLRISVGQRIATGFAASDDGKESV